MAEYIDRNKIPWAKTDNPKGKYWDRIVCESTIKNMKQADVIERPEYEYLKKENRELAIKYDNAMNMIINEHENVTRLRSKIDKAIEEIKEVQAKTRWTEDMQEWACYKKVLDILEKI